MYNIFFAFSFWVFFFFCFLFVCFFALSSWTVEYALHRRISLSWIATRNDLEQDTNGWTARGPAMIYLGTYRTRRWSKRPDPIIGWSCQVLVLIWLSRPYTSNCSFGKQIPNRILSSKWLKAGHEGQLRWNSNTWNHLNWEKNDYSSPSYRTASRYFPDSLAIRPYHPSLPKDLPGYILCSYRTAVDNLSKTCSSNPCL